MSEENRSRLSPAQRTDIWSRWKAGQSLHENGRAFGKPHSSIRCLLLPRGGIPPAARRRNSLLLYPFERFLISCASFSISSAFFTRFNESTFVESVLSTSAFNSVAS
jgi:transposase, IS30 family